MDAKWKCKCGALNVVGRICDCGRASKPVRRAMARFWRRMRELRAQKENRRMPKTKLPWVDDVRWPKFRKMLQDWFGVAGDGIGEQQLTIKLGPDGRVTYYAVATVPTDRAAGGAKQETDAET